MILSMMFAALETAENEGGSSSFADSFRDGVFPGLAFCEEVKAPATLHMKEEGSIGEWLECELET